MLDIKTSNSVVANRVREIMKDKMIKQTALAEKAGFTIQEFNDMLNGRRLMRAVDIASIINALRGVGVDANYLFMIDTNDDFSEGMKGEQ